MIIDEKVSIIIPYVNEWPQIAFTLRAISEQLRDSIDYEVIAVDNYCKDIGLEGIPPDRGHHRWTSKIEKGLHFATEQANPDKYEFSESHINSMSKQNPWLKYVHYKKKLSHWNAKNEGVKASTGKYLLFLDAHVIPSRGLLRNALWSFHLMANEEPYLNTLHFPLTYHILENRKLIYKLIYNQQEGIVHYSFTPMPFVEKNKQVIFEVPCMSTCGMMMTRSLFDLINGWPTGLGIYGGGENYINFTLAVIGSKKFIYPYGSLHHHGEKRNYSFNWVDYHRNRLLASMIYGDENLALKYLRALGENETTWKMLLQAKADSLEHRKIIDPLKKTNIHDWVKEWGH